MLAGSDVVRYAKAASPEELEQAAAPFRTLLAGGWHERSLTLKLIAGRDTPSLLVSAHHHSPSA
jgi:hypothetical protein